MKLDTVILSRIEALATPQRGIFTIHGLKNLFQVSDVSSLNQKLKPYRKANILLRFSRGYYVTKNCDLEALSQRICPNSAISFGNVLAKELLIGAVPKKTVYATKAGKSRTYSSQPGHIVHLGFTGSQAGRLVSLGSHWEGGICYADKEKAFLDTLYFYQWGRKFSFNIYSDIHTSLLDKRKIKRYLRHYQNPKFQKFVLGVLHG